jgi:hypothetical protein
MAVVYRAVDLTVTRSPARGSADGADDRRELAFAAPRECVRNVWVAGQQVVAEGHCTTVDLAEARAQVQRSAARIATDI